MMHLNTIRDYSSPYHQRHRPLVRRYTLSDSELSLPSVRLNRPESFTPSLPSSPYVHRASGHVITTAPPFIPFRTYTGTPPPFAPPALHYSISPYAPIPLPSQSSVGEPFSLHPLLQTSISTTVLDLDLSSSPDAIHSTLMIAATAGIFDPATQPPLPSMTITHPLLPWFITVHRSVSEHVTVLDVLHTICTDLNKRVERRRSQRHERNGDGLDAWEGRQRIEFLQGRYRFRGLRGIQSGEDVWELVTE
ncbi:hypothetical protein F5879DRAFT_47284 [Lentinula edodes]|nr:hypothetical protein F5879DRAFT_47284 [Lentinula edodes]